MFYRMLRAEAEVNPRIGVLGRFRFAMQRVLEIEDAQIMLASCVAGGRTNRTFSLRSEANRYLASLYPLYRWNHVRYAVRMLLRTVALRPTPGLVRSVTAAMWLAIKLRLLLARLALLLESVRAQGNPMSQSGQQAEPVGLSQSSC
jgi:hypothetical protein